MFSQQNGVEKGKKVVLVNLFVKQKRRVKGYDAETTLWPGKKKFNKYNSVGHVFVLQSSYSVVKALTSIKLNWDRGIHHSPLVWRVNWWKGGHPHTKRGEKFRFPRISFVFISPCRYQTFYGEWKQNCDPLCSYRLLTFQRIVDFCERVNL